MLLQSYAKELVAITVPLITWALNTFFKAKARLMLSTPHTFIFLVQQPLLDEKGDQISPTQTVHTQSIMTWNPGRETATRIQMVFNWKPLCVNVWPPRHFDEHLEPDSRYVMIFDSLAPTEYLGCEIMSLNRELPNLVTVRCDQCIAQAITMYPQPLISPAKRRIGAALVLAGLGAAIYLLLILLQYLILKTPLGYGAGAP